MATLANPLSAEEVGLLDAYWRAANYLSVGQIYLRKNALLREPLRPEHIKPPGPGICEVPSNSRAAPECLWC